MKNAHVQLAFSKPAVPTERYVLYIKVYFSVTLIRFHFTYIQYLIENDLNNT